MRRRIVIAAGIAAVVIAALALAAYFRPKNTDEVEASGIIEATQADVSTKIQGRLVSLDVPDGSPVKRGQLLAVLEHTTPSLDVDQARANLAAAAAQVSSARAAYDLQRQTYPISVQQAGEGVSIASAQLGQAGETLSIEERAAALRVDQAAAQLDGARASYRLAHSQYARTRSLVGTGDEPQRQLDDVTAQYRSAAAQLQAARAALALAQTDRRNVEIRRYGVQASGSAQRQSAAQLESVKAQLQQVAQRRAQLAAAQAQLAQARAALGLAQEQVRETRLRAPFDGYVVSHNFEAGDLLSPGAAVLTVADLRHPYVYVYVNETQLPRIKPGTGAYVTLDGDPNRRFEGKVTEIASSAKFTPENVQTKQQRIQYLVFRVKIQFTDTTGMLKPGLPVDAVIHV